MKANDIIAWLGRWVVVIAVAVIIAVVAIGIMAVRAHAQSCLQMDWAIYCDDNQTFQRLGNFTFDNRGQSWIEQNNAIFTNPFNDNADAIPIIEWGLQNQQLYQPQGNQLWPNTLYQSQ